MRILLPPHTHLHSGESLTRYTGCGARQSSPPNRPSPHIERESPVPPEWQGVIPLRSALEAGLPGHCFHTAGSEFLRQWRRLKYGSHVSQRLGLQGRAAPESLCRCVLGQVREEYSPSSFPAVHFQPFVCSVQHRAIRRFLCPLLLFGPALDSPQPATRWRTPPGRPRYQCRSHPEYRPIWRSRCLFQ